MKMITKLTVMFGLLFSSFAVNALEINTKIGIASDYFWRGVSQNSHNASFSIGTELSHKGFYVGTWTGQVDFGDDASLEKDFYGGYSRDLTDNISIGVGAIRYMYDQGYDATDEVFVTGSYRGIEGTYYKNPDESDLDYFSVGLLVPGISVVDVKLMYGQWGDGRNHKGFTLSRSLTDKIDLGLLVKGTVRQGQFWDNAAASITYSF